MNNLRYVIGDATKPIGNDNRIIAHICNNKNRWGAGFVLALNKRWSEPEAHYRGKSKYVLGDVDIIRVEDNIYVANMIAQENTHHSNDGTPPIRYQAVAEALMKVNKIAKEMGATLHAPMFGTGLAGGKWTIIEKIIDEVITVPITIYVLNEKDLPQKKVNAAEVRMRKK